MGGRGLFGARARSEAWRYGDDAWVFVRELIQNARDAGAAHVWFNVEYDEEVERLVCRDDGSGLTLAEARQDLFTLYASSKSSGRDGTADAGRFGVGFWSVLRFEPRDIVVRSGTRDGRPWQVRMNGSLEDVEFEEAPTMEGTEVALCRPRSGEDLEAQVRAAILADAPFVTRRDAPRETVGVFVNGRKCGREFGLASPSVAFSRRRLRGAVALTGDPGVDVYAHGLRVRTAATLDDLLVRDGRGRSASMKPALPEGLAPRVMLDSRAFDVLMNRGDLRENRALRRAVEVVRQEIVALVERELDRSAPLTMSRRCGEVARRFWTSKWSRRGAVMLVLGVAIGLLLTPIFDRSAVPRPLRSVVGETAAPGMAVFGYRDIGALYRGPAVHGLDRRPSPIMLRFEPAGRKVYFTVYQVPGLARDGACRGNSIDEEALLEVDSRPAGPTDLTIDLLVTAPPGPMRLPLPTGHVVDPVGLEIDGRGIDLYELPDGSSVVILAGETRAKIQYRTGPAPAGRDFVLHSWPELPAAIRDQAHSLEGFELEERVIRALQLVRSLVSYDASSASADRLNSPELEGASFFERVVEAGVGDCDVQAALLTAVLREAGVPAAMMIGHVGEYGIGRSALHAWVEYDDGQGSRGVADPSSAGPLRQPGQAPRGGDVSPSGAVAGTGVESVFSAVVWPVTGVVLVSVLIVAWLYRSGRRTFDCGAGIDLEDLVRGALSRPRAYRGVPLLFSRPLLPLVGGRTISLDRARSMLREGRLYASELHGPLAQRAAGEGRDVIDRRSPAGRVAADLLAPVDLDHWHRMYGQSYAVEITRSVEKALACLGQKWRVRVVPGIETLDCLQLGKFRLVVIGDESDLWQSATTRGGAEFGTLLLAEAVTRFLDLPGTTGEQMLGKLARAAVEA